MRVSGNRRPRGGRSNTSNGRSGASSGRGNSSNNRRSNNSNRSYDSNGPDGKIRGSATQVYDKYVSLGRDAQTSGDHVAAENYYQHGEHYYRIMLANNLVKLDRSSEDDEETNSNDDENQTDGAEVATSNEQEKSEVRDNSTAEATVQEPIIIDLSDPDRAEPAENNKASSQAVGQDEGDEAEEANTSEADGDEKPKTKRRVSRARGLRRRTTPRKSAADEENDEPQSA